LGLVPEHGRCPFHNFKQPISRRHPVIARSVATKQSRLPSLPDGLLRFARNDASHIFAFSRRDAPEVCQKLPPKQRAQGMPDARCTRGLVRKGESGMRARAYRLSGGIRHPLRNGFTAYAVLSPATNSSCHRRRRISRVPNPVGSSEPPPTWHQQRVSGPHGFAVRYNVVRPARRPIAHEVQLALRHQWRTDALASITSHPAFVTTRDRPSCRNRMAWGLQMF
jgi:hypothetical protein